MGHQLAGIHLVAGSRQPMPSPRRPTPPIRLWAHLRGRSLDRALGAGSDPAAAATLAHRSAWLTSPRQRRSLAYAIRRLLEPGAGQGLSAAIQPHRRGLEAARPQLTRVAV